MKATCKNCGYQWEKGTDSNHTKDDCIERLKERVEELTEVAVNFITHSVDIRQIQLKCYSNEYEDVKSVGKDIPTYQTMRLQKMLKAISRPTESDLCKKGTIYLYNQTTEQGE